MSHFEDTLVRIKHKIELLKGQNSELSKENEELISQVIKLNEINELNEKRIKELENKNLNLQFSNSLDGEDKEKINMIINEMINEIDKGLELLKR